MSDNATKGGGGAFVAILIGVGIWYISTHPEVLNSGNAPDLRAVPATAAQPAPVVPIDIPSAASGNYPGLCAEQWTKRGVLDHEMFAYCVNRENEGHARLVSQITKYRGQPGFDWLGAALRDAGAKWTKRDTRQDTMVAYEMDRQIDAFLDLRYSAQHPGYQKGPFDRCFDEWNRSSTDWAMVEYCYKQAIGAR